MNELTTREQLEERIGTPSSMVNAKMIAHLDSGALTWIGASAIMIASTSRNGEMDVLIGGGPSGWAGGDERTLTLPFRFLDDPERLITGSGFGSIFLVPSLREVLRVNGRIASTHGDVVRVAVEECYVHCGKALIRSDFWSAPAGLASDTVEDLVRNCRFLAFATSDPNGHADLSPKGDPAGQMARLDDDALCFADRPGNKRIDSFRNIVQQPRVAAALLVPGTADIVTVRGTARITDDLSSRERFAVSDKVPDLVTQVTCTTVDRSRSAALGRASAWPAPPPPAGLSAGKIAAGHLKLARGIGAKLAGAVMSVPGLVERELAKDYKKNLY